jgi:hypothetical protein
VNRQHVNVSVARDYTMARFRMALAAGGHIIDDAHAPSRWTLADRAGNHVCTCIVIGYLSPHLRHARRRRRLPFCPYSRF